MYAGYLLFLGIAIMAFWMLIFLFGVAIPYWLTQGAIYKLSKNKADDAQPIEIG